MDTDTREVTRNKQLVQFDCPCDGFHEDDNLFGKDWTTRQKVRGLETNLVEFQSVEQLVQLPVLSDFVQLHEVLLESMQGQLRLIVNEYFERLKKVTSE